MRQTVAFIVALACAAGVAGARAAQSQEADALRAADAPANAVFVDTLDLSAVTATVIRPNRGRGAGRGGEPAAPPPAPMYMLGGVAYPHAVPMQSDRDLS